MITTEQRRFSAATNKLAYAQAFSSNGTRRVREPRSLRSLLAARRNRSRAA